MVNSNLSVQPLKGASNIFNIIKASKFDFKQKAISFSATVLFLQFEFVWVDNEKKFDRPAVSSDFETESINAIKGDHLLAFRINQAEVNHRPRSLENNLEYYEKFESTNVINSFAVLSGFCQMKKKDANTGIKIKPMKGEEVIEVDRHRSEMENETIVCEFKIDNFRNMVNYVNTLTTLDGSPLIQNQLTGDEMITGCDTRIDLFDTFIKYLTNRWIDALEYTTFIKELADAMGFYSGTDKLTYKEWPLRFAFIHAKISSFNVWAISLASGSHRIHTLIRQMLFGIPQSTVGKPCYGLSICDYSQLDTFAKKQRISIETTMMDKIHSVELTITDIEDIYHCVIGIKTCAEKVNSRQGLDHAGTTLSTNVDKYVAPLFTHENIEISTRLEVIRYRLKLFEISSRDDNIQNIVSDKHGQTHSIIFVNSLKELCEEESFFQVYGTMEGEDTSPTISLPFYRHNLRQSDFKVLYVALRDNLFNDFCRCTSLFNTLSSKVGNSDVTFYLKKIRKLEYKDVVKGSYDEVYRRVFNGCGNDASNIQWYICMKTLFRELFNNPRKPLKKFVTTTFNYVKKNYQMNNKLGPDLNADIIHKSICSCLTSTESNGDLIPPLDFSVCYLDIFCCPINFLLCTSISASIRTMGKFGRLLCCSAYNINTPNSELIDDLPGFFSTLLSLISETKVPEGKENKPKQLHKSQSLNKIVLGKVGSNAMKETVFIVTHSILMRVSLFCIKSLIESIWLLEGKDDFMEKIFSKLTFDYDILKEHANEHIVDGANFKTFFKTLENECGLNEKSKISIESIIQNYMGYKRKINSTLSFAIYGSDTIKRREIKFGSDRPILTLWRGYLHRIYSMKGDNGQSRLEEAVVAYFPTTTKYNDKASSKPSTEKYSNVTLQKLADDFIQYSYMELLARSCVTKLPYSFGKRKWDLPETLLHKYRINFLENEYAPENTDDVFIDLTKLEVQHGDNKRFNEDSSGDILEDEDYELSNNQVIVNGTCICIKIFFIKFISRQILTYYITLKLVTDKQDLVDIDAESVSIEPTKTTICNNQTGNNLSIQPDDSYAANEVAQSNETMIKNVGTCSKQTTPKEPKTKHGKSGVLSVGEKNSTSGESSPKDENHKINTHQLPSTKMNPSSKSTTRLTQTRGKNSKAIDNNPLNVSLNSTSVSKPSPEGVRVLEAGPFQTPPRKINDSTQMKKSPEREKPHSPVLNKKRNVEDVVVANVSVKKKTNTGQITPSKSTIKKKRENNDNKKNASPQKKARVNTQEGENNDDVQKNDQSTTTFVKKKHKLHVPKEYISPRHEHTDTNFKQILPKLSSAYGNNIWLNQICYASPSQPICGKQLFTTKRCSYLSLFVSDLPKNVDIKCLLDGNDVSIYEEQSGYDKDFCGLNLNSVLKQKGFRWIYNLAKPFVEWRNWNQKGNKDSSGRNVVVKVLSHWKIGLDTARKLGLYNDENGDLEFFDQSVSSCILFSWLQQVVSKMHISRRVKKENSSFIMPTMYESNEDQAKRNELFGDNWRLEYIFIDSVLDLRDVLKNYGDYVNVYLLNRDYSDVQKFMHGLMSGTRSHVKEIMEQYVSSSLSNICREFSQHCSNYCEMNNTVLLDIEKGRILDGIVILAIDLYRLMMRRKSRDVDDKKLINLIKGCSQFTVYDDRVGRCENRIDAIIGPSMNYNGTIRGRERKKTLLQYAFVPIRTTNSISLCVSHKWIELMAKEIMFTKVNWVRYYMLSCHIEKHDKSIDDLDSFTQLVEKPLILLFENMFSKQYTTSIVYLWIHLARELFELNKNCEILGTASMDQRNNILAEEDKLHSDGPKEI